MTLAIFVVGDKIIKEAFGNAEQNRRARGKHAMQRILAALDRDAQKILSRKLKRRTGNLARLQQEINIGAHSVVGKIGPVVKYGRIHELGGTIRPKKGRFLAIPSDRIRTAAGVARASPRDFPDAFFHRRGERLYLLRRVGGGGRLELLFTLVKRVKMPKRAYLAPALKKQTKNIEQQLGDDYVAAVTPRR